MTQEYTQYVYQSDSNYQLEFEIDLNLINILRSFEHKDHEFKEGYLESIFALLYYYQGKPDTELFSEFISKSKGPSLEALIFVIHFYIGSMANLDPLMKALGVEQPKVTSLSKSDLNKTNILTVHSIMDRVGKIDHELLVQKSKEVKPYYLHRFKVRIVSNESAIETRDEQTLYLDYYMINLAIKAKGKLDPFAVSYIANLINAKYSIELSHILLYFCQSKRTATENYANQFIDICRGVMELNFNKERYRLCRSKLVQFRGAVNQVEELAKFLSDIESDVGRSMIARDKVSTHYLEKVLIGMLGHPLIAVRDQAVILLNMIYDGVDWQRRAPYKPRISKVGSWFKIEYLFENEENQNPNAVILLLKSFIFDQQCQQNVVSWHRPRLTEYKSVGGTSGKKYLVFNMDFGKFKRCGIYDWKLIRLTQTGKLASVYKIMNMDNIMNSTVNLQQLMMESKPIQGRFIVQPGYSKELQVHEIYVDLVDARPDYQGKFTKRGNFRKVRDRLSDLKDTGVNCIYLMGALERDNGYAVDTNTKQKNFARPDSSPLAVTCRRTPNTMLGGSIEFQSLLQKAKELDVKIIVDALTRVASARSHKKYRKDLLHKLDESGRLVPLFGSDGRALQFEDTAILNYRKKRVWDLFLSEIVLLREQFGISGVYLDNCQTWPQIFSLNVEEMYRQESNGELAYTDKQIFDGEVVYHNEDCGYWGSNVKNLYPNPFLIKMCKKIWEKYPDFLIIGETWGCMDVCEERELNLIQSGIIPRLFKLPVALASVLGEQLNKDGTMVSMDRKNITTLRKYLEQTSKEYPRGSIIVQSTTYHSWPYPALIFKRGTWAAIDLFFTLTSVPMTFLGEQEGHVFREKTTHYFSYENKTPISKENKMPRIDSSIMTQSMDELGFGFNTYGLVQSQTKFEGSSVMPRIQSGQSLSEMDISRIEGAQEDFRREVGPEFGFDLKHIGKHYEHRRKMRSESKVLRRGRFIALSAEHQHGWHTHVLSFCRYTKREMVLVAINFNDGQVDLFMNLQNLKYYFTNYETSNLVVKLSDWSGTNQIQDQQYYYIGELINERLFVTLGNFKTQIWRVQIFQYTPLNHALVVNSALKRLINSINSKIPQVISNNYHASQLVILASKCKDLQSFINGYTNVYYSLLKPNNFNLNSLLSKMKVFIDDRALLCRLFAFINASVNKLANLQEYSDLYEDLVQVINENKLGKICFMCPELGKWTTTGGLGVMVDELTQELAKMNEEVMVITPYYERNKKGDTGYLESEGFTYKQNVEVRVGGVKYIVGVHYGEVNRVHIYWLHNPELFPTAYAGEDSKYVMKQLAVFAKGSLEALCQMNLIPALIVTNDWFCGLIPAYVKDPKFFGQSFVGTKCFHICHNLDALYEGRLYPNHQDETLDYIHELNNNQLIDPFWGVRVFNPSRCALLNCDNWGTVSNSYKAELLKYSALAPVLRQYPSPFASPNGIRREQRLKIIYDRTKNDHLGAKAEIQKKYFGCQQLRNDIPVFGFVGRITKQKGVHMICEIAEELIKRMHGQIQIIVGGPADMREEYSSECAHRLNYLHRVYPLNFWADPAAFFYDGTLLNVGCDFALMPSMFEPGGIVQHEFFIGSTPVVAFKTGGLRDTVHEYDRKTQKGSGFTFEQYTRADFMYSMERAMGVYKETDHYQKLRKNAFDAAIDVADVGRAWAQEFYRLSKKNFIDKELVNDHLKNIDQSFNSQEIKQDDSIFNKVEGRAFTSKDENIKNFERILTAAKRTNLRQHIFTYKTNVIPQPRQVLLGGSFDEWKETHQLKFDHFSKTWNTSLQLPPGEYFFKYMIDNEWACHDDDLKDTDLYGNLNNFVIVQ